MNNITKTDKQQILSYYNIANEKDMQLLAIQGNLRVFDDMDDYLYWMYIDNKGKCDLMDTVLELLNMVGNATDSLGVMLANESKQTLTLSSGKVVFKF